MKRSGCSVSQCLILHIIKGKTPEDLCMTDWGHANQVQCSQLHRSDRSHQRPGKAPVPRFEYHVKEKKPFPNAEKLKADAVVQIGEIKVPIKDTGKELMDIEKSVVVPVQKPVMPNDHGAGSSKSAEDNYHQPRWCPSGLTHTQKRKLQRLRNKEKKEQEAEKIMDDYFNKYRPMIPQGKFWQIRTADQPAGPVRPL